MPAVAPGYAAAADAAVPKVPMLMPVALDINTLFAGNIGIIFSIGCLAKKLREKCRRVSFDKRDFSVIRRTPTFDYLACKGSGCEARAVPPL
jgi:hypothetical protein